MSKYAHIEESGKLIGWYDDTIHGTIPTPNIKVTEDQWKKAISFNANFYDGDKFIVKDLRTEQEKELDTINKLKHDGVDYNGYKVPITDRDALTMIKVKNAFEMGETSTNIKFSNGTVVPMKASGFVKFGSWFAKELNKFFKD